MTTSSDIITAATNAFTEKNICAPCQVSQVIVSFASKNFAAWKQAAKRGVIYCKQIEIMNGVSFKIGQWQQAQRTKQKRLSADRIKQLELNDFVWRVTSKYE
jgi:hypothetical protein